MEKCVPKLRFPEFNGEWKEESFENIFKHIRNGFVGTIKPYYTNIGGVRYIQGTNIHDGKISDNVKMYVTNEFDKKHTNSQLSTNDILVVQSGHVGECAVVTEKYDGSNCHALIIMTPTKKVKAEFIVELLNSDGQQKALLTITTGNTVKHILASEMKKYKCKIPNLDEQIKLADFIGITNKRIYNQSAKVDTLTELKKGIMQKIFSQEIRFKREDGGEYPKWDALLLVNLIKKKFKGALPRVIKDGNILLNNDFLDNNAEPILVDNNINVSEDDVLILWDGSQSGRAYTGFKGVLGSTLIGLALKKDIADNRFIQKYLEFKLDTIQSTWRTGSGVPHVTKEFVEKFIIPVPSIKEQQKIADFLSTLDSKIDIETQILSTLQTLKKGLLQQMFV